MENSKNKLDMRPFFKWGFILVAVMFVGIIGHTVYTAQMEGNAAAFKACRSHILEPKMSDIPEWLRCVADVKGKV